MVGDSKDGLVDSMVDDWGWLGHWDDTAAHLTWKLHRNLPARVFIVYLTSHFTLFWD